MNLSSMEVLYCIVIASPHGSLLREDEDLPDRPPSHGFERVARDPFAGAIESDDSPVSIENHDERADRVENGRGEVALARQLELYPFGRGLWATAHSPIRFQHNPTIR